MEGQDDLLLRVFGPKQTQALTAPWTDPQIRALNKYQRTRPLKTFKCPKDREGWVLTATYDGWLCMDCGFRLPWALPEMLRPEEAKEPNEEMRLRVEKWNEDHPNLDVKLRYDDPELSQVITVKTRSRAFLHSKYGPSVHVTKVKGPVPLEGFVR